MAESLSRELILPARRLGVPTRPSERQLAAFAERSAEQWSTNPRDWATQQVVRLAVAAVLSSQAGRTPDVDPASLTLAEVARSFRPHVGLAAQAFRLAMVESVNARVPAAADPLRETLRRMGVTGREPLVMVALGLDRVPGQDPAGQEFWSTVRTSTTVTAIVDGLASGGHRVGDMSKLDRRQLTRADALVLAAGKVTAVSLGTPPASGGSWLPVPVALTRPRRRAHDEQPRKGAATEIVMRADGWTDVFETALDALGAAMHQLDTGQRPRGRSSVSVDALAHRLVSARKRSVADVVASLRAIDPFVLEMFDDEIAMTDVRVAVPVLEDDALAGLWLSPEALAAPLVTGAADLFFGGRAAEPRPQAGGARRGGARPERRGPAPQGRGKGAGGGSPERGGRGALPTGGRRRDGSRPTPHAAPDPTPDPSPSSTDGATQPPPDLPTAPPAGPTAPPAEPTVAPAEPPPVPPGEPSTT